MPPTLSLSFRSHPWVYFSIFLLSNTLIAYSALSPEGKGLLALLGILLPLYVAFRSAPALKTAERPPYQAELSVSPSLWFWGLALLALVFLRFYKLETLFRWPTLDEGWIGALALGLSRHWIWKFFYTFGQAPPLPVWCAALLFKGGASPALALWLPSAAASFGVVFLGHLAARQFFSRSFSLVCGGLLAFSYWPLFIGRFCHQGTWLPLWVCLFLYAWGRFLKPGGAKGMGAAGLGLALGLGSFTFTPWLAVAPVFYLSAVGGMLGKPRKDWRAFSFFTGAFFLSLIPFLLAVSREGYGQHILSLTPWGGWFHQLDFLQNFFRYFAVLVWGAYEKDPAYTPLWGGFLNPLLGSFFWVGLIEMFRLRRFGLIQWTAAAFLLFLLPGALSPNLETFRIVQVLPLLLFVAALGIHLLLETFPRPKRLALLGLLLGFTAIIDFSLLTAPYRNPEAHPENFGRPLKSIERYRAYNLLVSEKKNSPGFILADLDVDSLNDPTLRIMAHSFNAAEPDFAGTASWLAIFVDANYEPFLKERFTRKPQTPASKNLFTLFPTGPEYVLGFLSLVPSNGKVFNQWLAAHRLFQQADEKRFSQNTGLIKASIQTLEEGFPIVRGDPFLESLYWDKRAAYEYEDLDYDQQLFSYRMAVTRGYPTADLYFKLGELFRVRGRWKEARTAYLKALQAPGNRTPAREALEWLGAQTPENSGTKSP